ncbi:hypothetical protein QT06_C0001G0676 [archaeon GW2011_AR15]|nr:hypothetical protein QT06_C0001G0676 [archaeon GW2011_AR15]MBS3103537.1 hypothetical protein [Candidatus Woesearchaeota archaeon]
MKKYIAALILLAVITACTGGSGEADLEKDIYKGTTGVVLSFFENSLGDEVFENEQLNLPIKLENKGAYQVTNSKLVVATERGFIEFSNGNNIYQKSGIRLDGKSVFVTFDDFHIEELVMNVKELDPQSEYHDSFITVNFCYDYKTSAFAEVCIDTDPHGQRVSDKACSQINSISMSEGQGGPVVIERVETRMLVVDNFIKPQFKIYISNRGEGTVISPNRIDSVCSQGSIGQETYNSLRLTALDMSGFSMGSFECIPSELVLYNDEDFITCTLKTGISRDRQPYLTPLKVELSYGYMETASKEIKIKKILRY